jgi:adenylate cyclase
MERLPKKLIITLGLALGVAAFVVGLSLLGTLDTLEEGLRDRFFLAEPPPEDVVIIAVDEASLEAVGRWPWDRKIHAELLAALDIGGARAVGFDVNFAEPQDEINDALLEGALEKLPIVLPAEAHDLSLTRTGARADSLTLPLKRFLKPNVSLGHVNILSDDDAIARRVALAVEITQGQTLPAFAVRMLETTLPTERSAPAASGIQRIHYLGPAGTFHTVSYKDVLNGTIAPQALKGKIAFVGVTAPDLHDTLVTPAGRGQTMPGVEVHANIFEMLRRGNFLLEIPLWLKLLAIILPSALMGALFSLLKKLRLIIGLALVCAFSIPLLGAAAFDRGRIAPLLYPLISLGGSFAVIASFRYTSEAKEKRWIRETWERYVSPHVVAALIRDPSRLALGGEKREITVLFCDIRGFTSWSEKLAPEELVPLLNEYLSALTEVILAEDGVLDKYIGDAIMAFWGAPLDQPDHALRALNAARKMVERLDALNSDWASRGIAPLKNGVGIATGMAVVGNIGSLKRLDYTVIGDTVNTASRLESATKELGAGIVFSETTAEKAKAMLPIKPLGEIMVKGKEKPVKVYTVA